MSITNRNENNSHGYSIWQLKIKLIAYMKQNIFLFLVIILLNSCSSKEHLIFNNVPIEGRLDKFVSELTKTGFNLSDSTKKNEVILNGEFLKKDCKIYALGTNKNNIVYKVIVELPKEVHDSLQNSFEKIQQLFSLKYGIGTSRYQQYRTRESLLFNVPRLKRDIRTGDFTKYTTDSGDIIMEVQEGNISITYLDKLNNEIRQREIDQGGKKEINEENNN